MKIIAFYGKKGSGKTTLSEYAMSYLKMHYGLPCKKVAFAEKFKRNVCIDILGLDEKICFGSDEQKNTITKYKWEDLPHYPRLVDEWKSNNQSIKTGLMTYREIMQEVGTGLFRTMDYNIWCENLFKAIKNTHPSIAKFFFIDDCRFPNEVEYIKKNGGIIIKLTRSIDNNDIHVSETALNKYDDSNFDLVLDNKNLNLADSKIQLNHFLEDKFTFIKCYLDEDGRVSHFG